MVPSVQAGKEDMGLQPVPEVRRLPDLRKRRVPPQPEDGMKRKGAPCVAILPEWIALQFDHIGTSYQHTEEDKGN